MSNDIPMGRVEFSQRTTARYGVNYDKKSRELLTMYLNITPTHENVTRRSKLQQ
jgi:hypothetical protein